MDKLNHKCGTIFTAEEVRKYLGLDNDYDDDSSTSSSDNNLQDDLTLDSSSITDIDFNESDNEAIIPPSPKRIKSINPNREKGKDKKNIFTNTCIQVDVTGEKEEHGTVQNITSGNNPSLETLHKAEPTYTPTSETHTQFKSNHDEQNSLLNFEPVPEPVFTIQLDIPALHEDTSTSTNTVEIHVPAQETVQNQHEVNTFSISIHVPQTQNTDHSPQTQSSPPHEIEFPSDYHPDNEVSHNEDENEYYEVETEPTPPDMTDLCTPITNYSRDQINEFDVTTGWEKIEPDIIPDHGPFTGIQGINMSGNSREPEDFFNDIFEERMFTIMAEETNNYARRKIRELMAGRDHVQQMDHYSHRQHARLGQWKDLHPSDMKIFTAHLLIMSSVHKPALHNYWSTKTLSRTPFFGQYIGRNKFQEILWNLHVADSTENPHPGSPNHDPLAKVRPLLEMCQTNFRLRYTPGQHISLDESTMAFKGRVR